MKKTFYTLFLLLMCFLCLPFGSAYAKTENVFEENAFRIVRKSYDDGHISLTYVFPLNSKLLKQQGFSDGQTEIFRFYLTSYVNALAKSNSDKKCDDVSVENAKYFTDVDGVGFSIVFENLDAQQRFFGVDSDKSDSKNKQKKSGFFIRKTQIFTTFPVSSKKSAGDLKMVCLLAVSSWANNSEMSDDKKQLVVSNYADSVFVYDFATQTRGLKSEVMYQDENFYHNVFIKTLDELEQEQKISFWVTSVNTPVWYIGAIVVVSGGMFLVWFFAKVRKNKKKCHSK